MLNRLRELIGIYGLGFDPDSFMGIMLPFAFVVIVGGIGIFLVTDGFGFFPNFF